ncbi:hypothetical protein BDZ94DRAFT_1297647 [Collybia nuda]|uniref:CHAT domain-containing protein n=1 Tax=Collybia nuda TaxID=64659 RepID=A0A9P6CFC8_9AGAR|nr:hypothetical protein BDZ94DRAFT_1297647 [Collybia nuda]
MVPRANHPNRIENLENILEKALLEGKQTIKLYSDLGEAYYQSYGKTHQQQDLENAVKYFQCGLGDFSGDMECHCNRPIVLDNLGRALLVKCEQLGKMEDLIKAIAYHQEVFNLSPIGFPGRCMSLNNLGRALKIQYEQFGEMADLEKAMGYLEQALYLSLLGHHLRVFTLNNLAITLQIRYEQLGVATDLGKAIAYYEEAVDLCLLNHSLRSSSLCNLASALQSRHEKYRRMEDLEKAITCHQQAIDMCPSGHALRPSALNNLAIALQIRYERLGKMEDLEKAITFHNEALVLRPPGHPLRSSSLNNLANAFQIKYEHLEHNENLEKAITYHKQALDLRSLGHPFRSASLDNLGHTFYAKYQKLGNQEDVIRPITFYEQATTTISKLPDRLQQLILLPTITSQQELVEKSSHLFLDAAACALSAGTPDIAVQLLGQGRSILWSKIQGYRQSFKDISKKVPDLAQEFQAISKNLEKNATSAHVDIPLQCALSEKWMALLGKMRKLEGFSDYLQVTPFEILKNASAEGPVIMIHCQGDPKLECAQSQVGQLPAGRGDPEYIAYGEILRDQSEDSLPRWGHYIPSSTQCKLVDTIGLVISGLYDYLQSQSRLAIMISNLQL